MAELRVGARIYDEAVRVTLVVLWEAADRICGKRLKALLPTLIAAMERHGHLQLEVMYGSNCLRSVPRPSIARYCRREHKRVQDARPDADDFSQRSAEGPLRWVRWWVNLVSAW